MMISNLLAGTLAYVVLVTGLLGVIVFYSMYKGD